MPSLREYARKRRFTRTPEPKGTGPAGGPSGGPARTPRSGTRSARPSRSGTRSARPPRSPNAKPRLYVIQKHRATALHYDFRLEDAGVLRSWAVPKGPSLDPSVKRLAMQVEDHPVEYATFEGVIPAGEYGGGTVMVWDIGTWELGEGSFDSGRVRFTVHGRKLRGAWRLVRTRGRQWLLIKSRDTAASTADITLAKPRSVLSRRLMAGIAKASGGDVEKAATADP